MQPRQKLSELVKHEMQRRGRWKLRNPGGSASEERSSETSAPKS